MLSCPAEFEKLAANHRYPAGDGNGAILSSIPAKSCRVRSLLAESQLTRRLFVAVLGKIAALPEPSG